MPGTNGVELAHRIKKLKPNMPLLALSSLNEYYDDDTVFIKYLIKPVKTEKLVSYILKALNISNDITNTTNHTTNDTTDDITNENNRQLRSEPIYNPDINILIVEDNITNQKVILGLLQKLGYVNCQIAGDGFTAYDKIKETDYDVVLLDLKMPNMNGITLAKKIRELETTENRIKTKIIAVTAAATQKEKDEYLSENVLDAYIVKPVEISILQQNISKIINKHSAKKKKKKKIDKNLKIQKKIDKKEKDN
jgi:CheY-like chemotaxis protein